MQPLLLLCLVSTVLALPVDQPGPSAESCGYASCTEHEADMLNVHIVAHTHDDVGWLKTVDQYYYGTRNNIQHAGVQYILDSVVMELWENPKRRFVYVESFFFFKWWYAQSDDVKQKVHTLVKEGRLQFAGGAWSMNDEAAAHYHSTIDQFTFGLGLLNDTFGHCGMPTVGWQIDPFGHSREFASLLAGMGYDGVFFGRIDYQDKSNRVNKTSMEMLWRGDDDIGKPSDIFGGVLYNMYQPPPGFCFDVFCSDLPIVTDRQSPEYNVDSRVDEFLKYVKKMSEAYGSNNVVLTMGGDFHYQDARIWFDNLDKLIMHVPPSPLPAASNKMAARRLCLHVFVSEFLAIVANMSKVYKTNNILVTMGDDFNYQYASTWFTNLDKLITYTNMKAAKDELKIKLFYSTPQCYLKAVKDANPTLPTKQDDFFPYASERSHYWTGYYTSRATTKYFERETNRYLQMAKQMQVLAGLEEHNMFVLNELKSAMGIMQHHDAITGTEQQHVAHDYERILNNAIEDSLIIPRQAFNKFMQGDAANPPSFLFARCRLNESSCDVSETSNQFVVTVYNHLAWQVNEPIRIPVLEGSYEVYAPNGEKIASQLVDIPEPVKKIPTRISKATHEIVFIAYLHPLSYKSFYIKKIHTEEKINAEDDAIENEGHPDGENGHPNIGNNIRQKRKTKDALNENMDKTDGAVDDLKKVDFIVGEDSYSNQLGNLGYGMMGDDPSVVTRYPDDLSIDNQYLKLRINPLNQIMLTLPDETNMKLDVKYCYYITKNSGAYIFQPYEQTPKDVTQDIIKGPTGFIVKEFRIYTEENIFSSIRIYDGLNYIENDWVVGPIHVTDVLGKEVIVRYITDLVNNGEFYTDSNGRQMLKRKLGFRPQWNVTLPEPVAGNYYPIVNKISIQNDNVKVAVVTDRSEGGSSLEEGQLEVMLHRRLIKDDKKGVAEPLNETVLNGVGLVVRGRHRILLSKLNKDSSKTLKDNIEEKKNVIELDMQPQVFVSNAKDLSLQDWLKLKNCYSWVNTLPEGIHLLTLEPWKENTLLLRLENYLELSDKDNTTIDIDLNSIFKTIKLKSFKETALAANRWLDEVNRWSWNTRDNFDESKLAKSANKDVEDDGFKIKIKARQIRTFVVEYELK